MLCIAGLDDLCKFVQAFRSLSKLQLAQCKCCLEYESILKYFVKYHFEESLDVLASYGGSTL